MTRFTFVLLENLLRLTTSRTPMAGGFPNSCAIVCCRPYDMLGKILTSKKKKNTDSLCATMYYEINKSKFAKIKASAFWKNGFVKQKEGTNSGDLNICVY